MSEKLVSVVISAYNAEKYVEQAIRAVINQTYKNLEIIITNDGSIDKTQEILERLTKEDARIKLINNEKKFRFYCLIK